MKVRIDAGGRVVEIECADANMSPKDLAEQARTLWEATEGARQSLGPAYGFTPSGAVTTPERGFMQRPIYRMEPMPVRATEECM